MNVLNIWPVLITREPGYHVLICWEFIRMVLVLGGRWGRWTHKLSCTLTFTMFLTNLPELCLQMLVLIDVVSKMIQWAVAQGQLAVWGTWRDEKEMSGLCIRQRVRWVSWLKNGSKQINTSTFLACLRNRAGLFSMAELWKAAEKPWTYISSAWFPIQGEWRDFHPWHILEKPVSD